MDCRISTAARYTPIRSKVLKAFRLALRLSLALHKAMALVLKSEYFPPNLEARLIHSLSQRSAALPLQLGNLEIYAELSESPDLQAVPIAWALAN